jgi:hypothetical protein
MRRPHRLSAARETRLRLGQNLEAGAITRAGRVITRKSAHDENPLPGAGQGCSSPSQVRSSYRHCLWVFIVLPVARRTHAHLQEGSRE